MERVVVSVVCLWILAVGARGQTGSPSQTPVPAVVPLASTNMSHSANPSYNITCTVTPRDKELHATILGLKAENVKLIHYRLKIRDWNPLTHLATEGWARVSNLHGQTLLSMEFTHGVMSLMTLTLGQKHMLIELEDSPPGCIGDLEEVDREVKLMKLLLRDFGNGSAMVMERPERICREVIVVEDNVAKFRNK